MSRSMSCRAAALATLVVAATLSGCGSRAAGRLSAQQGGITGSGGLTAGLTVTPPSSSRGTGFAAPSGLGGGPVSGGTGVAVGPTSGATAGPSGASALPGRRSLVQGGGSVHQTGPGKPVEIGIVFESNLGAAFGSAGLKGASNASDAEIETAIRHIASYVNAHGGFAGHPIQLVFNGVDPSRGTFDEASQAACSNLAEDHHVIAAVDGANVFTDLLPRCLAQHQIPLVWDYQYLVSDQTFRSYGPYLYQPAMLSAERLGAVVDVLATHGFFGSNPRVGLIRWDTADAAYFTDHVLKPRLAAHGIAVTDEFAADTLTGETDAGRQEAEMSNAVLKFRSERITHVLFAPTDTVAPWMFMSSAQSQGYLPKYGITSMDVPMFLVDNAPAAQVANTSGMGWTPEMDFQYASDFPKGNRLSDLCLSLNRDVGSVTSKSYLRYCDGLFFLQAAFNRARDLSPQSLASSVATLGSNYQSPWTIGTSFVNGRHDGPSTVHYLAYARSCRCFRYSGPSIRIP